MMRPTKPNRKLQQKYYSNLTRAGSYWGGKIYTALMAANEGKINQFELDEDLKKITEMRIKHVASTEKIENMQLYGITIPPLIKDWVVLPLLIPSLTIPLMSLIYYLPFSLLDSRNKVNGLVQEVPKSKHFIITKEFVDQIPQVLPPEPIDTSVPETPTIIDNIPPAAPSIDNIPPSKPSGLRIITN